MAGIGQIAGALGPIALGVGALAAIISKLDDSGTYHTGGAAQYSTASGLQAGQSGENFNIGFGRVEAGKETISAVGSIAKGLSTTFDSLAKTFGGKIGYEVSAAYADDSSKDRAWGGLAIRRNGVELTNWNNNRESKWAPREFADGEAGYKEYLKAVAQEARTVMLDPKNFDLPSWGRKIVEALGDDTDMDALTAAVEQINSIQAAFEQLGMGIKGFADMTDEAFAAIMKASGGIDALNSNASAYYNLFYSETERRDATRRQISNRFSELGLEAINYDATDAQAQFRALVDQQMALANQQTDASGETSTAASEAVAGLLALANSFAQVTTAAQEATAATEQAARKQATDAALSALQRAATAAREVAQLEADLWQERVDAARAVLEISRDAVRELRAETASTAAMSAAAANAYIDQVLGNAQATSYLPDAEEWSSAISAARGGITPGSYSNRLDYEAAQLQLANRIEAVGDIGQQQLTTGELLLEQAKAEVDRLDELYKTAQEDLAVQRGTQEAVLDVATAVRDFQAAMLAEREGGTSGSGSGSGTSSGSPFVIGGGNSGSSSAPVVDTNRPGAVGENGNYRREIPLYAGLSAWNTVDDQDQAHLERIAAIAAQFDGTGDVRGLVEATRAAGGSLSDLATVGGYYLADVNRVASDLGIPAFDVGINRVPYDMDARIHQDELIVPAKFNPFNPGASLPWGANEAGGSADVVAAISALQAQHYLVGRSILESLKTMETLARKNEAVGVKVRTP